MYLPVLLLTIIYFDFLPFFPGAYIPGTGIVVGIVSMYLGIRLCDALPTVSMQITRRFRV